MSSCRDADLFRDSSLVSDTPMSGGLWCYPVTVETLKGCTWESGRSGPGATILRGVSEGEGNDGVVSEGGD